MEFQQFQSPCPVTGHCGESLALSTFLTISYLYTLIRNPGPSLPQAERLQTSQPFLICQVLWSLNHLHSPVLDLLQKVHIILVLKCQELDLAQVLRIRVRLPPMTCWQSLPDAAQAATGHPCSKTALISWGPLAHQDPKVIVSRVASQTVSPAHTGC